MAERAKPANDENSDSLVLAEVTVFQKAKRLSRGLF